LSNAVPDEVPWRHGRPLLEEIAATAPPAGSLALWHIGQSGFVVRGGRRTLYFDPFLAPSTERLPRTWEPPFAAPDAAGVDYVFCSHAHADHLDPIAVAGIARASPQACFVAPEGALPRLLQLGIARERVHAARVDATVQYGPLVVRAVPAAHGDRAVPLAECVWEPDPERGYRYVGFVVELNGVCLYHAGDTVIYPGLIERLAGAGIGVALLPINGRDWFREQRQIIGNLDHREVADLGHAIGADVIVPMHYDMFAANPGFPGWFVDYCAATYRRSRRGDERRRANHELLGHRPPSVFRPSSGLEGQLSRS
jgi:L-ascorbate metabolism protein UlaG (beta-lactamase superfamily)